MTTICYINWMMASAIYLLPFSIKKRRKNKKNKTIIFDLIIHCVLLLLFYLQIFKKRISLVIYSISYIFLDLQCSIITIKICGECKCIQLDEVNNKKLKW